MNQIEIKGNCVYYNNHMKGQIINNCYVSNRTRDHIFRKFNGIGISTDILDYLMENNIENVVINFEDNRVYYVNVSKFLVFGVEWLDKDDNQLILSFKYWEEYKQFEVIKIGK